MTHAVHNVEQDAGLGPERDGLLTTHYEVVQLIALDILHEKSIPTLEVRLYSEVFRDEVRTTSF